MTFPKKYLRLMSLTAALPVLSRPCPYILRRRDSLHVQQLKLWEDLKFICSSPKYIVNSWEQWAWIFHSFGKSQKFRRLSSSNPGLHSSYSPRKIRTPPLSQTIQTCIIDKHLHHILAPLFNYQCTMFTGTQQGGRFRFEEILANRKSFQLATSIESD